MKKLIVLVFVLVITLSGCGFFDNDYDIVFETNGGTKIENIEVVLEHQIDIPLEPIKEDYIFFGWFSDIDLTSIYDFEGIVYSDMTLYAKWEYDGIVEPDSDIDLSSLPYSEYLDEANPVITIVVDGIGIMTLELFPSVAPNTVNNFIMYIENGDFAGNSFHRVIENFMIQGGNTFSTTCPINGDFIANGFNNDLSHDRGVISMARTSVMNSATSQFFVMHADSYFLDGNYAAFGGLIDGFNVLDYIAEIDTNNLTEEIE